jgi:hypothetical protein
LLWVARAVGLEHQIQARRRLEQAPKVRFRPRGAQRFRDRGVTPQSLRAKARGPPKQGVAPHSQRQRRREEAAMSQDVIKQMLAGIRESIDELQASAGAEPSRAVKRVLAHLWSAHDELELSRRDLTTG